MNKLCLLSMLLPFIVNKNSYGQKVVSVFKNYAMEEIPDNRFGEIHISRDGSVLVSASGNGYSLGTSVILKFQNR